MPKTLNTKKLRDAAYELNLTTYEIARQAGVLQSTVSKVLRGESSPSSERLRAICDVLDLDINDVFIKEEKLAA